MQKGYTLIEMMITVTIIGILAAIAIPAYDDYVTRAQAMEGYLLSKGVKDKLSIEHYTGGNIFSINGVQDKGTYTLDVKTMDGNIVATYGNHANYKLKGKKLIYMLECRVNTPTRLGDCSKNLEAKWVCTTNVKQKYIPVDVCKGV